MIEDWVNNIHTEANFWRSLADNTCRNERWRESLRICARGIDIVPGPLRPLIRPGIRILDVGAGPCTPIGCSLNGMRLDVTAIDPLAHEYEKILRDNNIVPCIKTQVGFGEKIENYVTGKFDVIYSNNALDHCFDPTACFRSMLSVANPGPTIMVRVSSNEGLRERYEGLHKWNFMQASDDLVIWNEKNRGMLLSEVIKDLDITSLSVESEDSKTEENRFVVITIRV